jgi:pilus assembly protein CpaB
LKRIRIIAAVAAVATALAIYFYLAGMKKPVDVVRGPVVVAVQKIAAGQVIQPEMVAVRNLPVEAINDQAARSVDEVVGRVSTSDAVPGEQMIVSRFYRAGDNNGTLAYALEKGKRAFTVSVNAESGISGLIKPRDHVDVLAILSVKRHQIKPYATEGLLPDDPDDMQYALGDEVDVVYSLLPLQNILVLATGQVMQADSGNSQTAVEQVTLSVTPEQAVLLNLCASEGKIRLALRSPIDNDTVDVEPKNIDDVIPVKSWEELVAEMDKAWKPGATHTPRPAKTPIPSPTPTSTPGDGATAQAQ